MKISSVTSKVIQGNTISNKMEKENDKFAASGTFSNNISNISLPSFHSTGRSLISFGKNETGSNVQKLMDEIKNTKDAIKALEESIGPRPSRAVQEAYEKIGNYDNWQRVKDSRYEDAKIKAEAARVENKRWYGSYGVNAYNNKINELYYNDKYKYELSPEDVDKYREIISLYEKTANGSAESKAVQLKILREKLIALEGQIDFASLREDIIKIMNNEGGIEERIAGYEDVKEEIKRVFVEPLAASVKPGGEDTRVPPAIMLYGALGCGKTAFLEAIEAQSKDYAVVLNLSNKLSPESSSFKKQMDAYLAAAARLYKEEGKRTIILLNEAERFFCMNKEDMGDSGMFFNESDFAKLAEYGSTGNSTSNVTEFKSMFDYISKIPTDDKPKGNATTVFITSNYPHLIHRDLLIRDGEYGKLMHIAVKPAADNDLRAVIKHYFKTYSDLIEKIKMYAKKDNYADLINSIPGITDKGKETIISKVKDGTIENMYIDPTCSGFRNFDGFIRGNNPSLARGAYSNARIQNCAKKAFVEYLKNPVIPYETHFCNIKNERGVDINPQTYRYFCNVYEMVQNPEKFKTITTIEENVLKLKQDYLDQQIEEEDMKIFEFQKQDIQNKYDKLKNKPDLTEMEQICVKQYKEFLDAVNF